MVYFVFVGVLGFDEDGQLMSSFYKEAFLVKEGLQ